MNYVLEVDENDTITGRQEKLYAHQKGILHRAFSIFIFNEKSELLLQQRAHDKYHCGGLWSNTCCSHPGEEEVIISAHKRLKEEMGFDCDLNFLQKYRYRATLNNGLIENELDYIYTGTYSGEVDFNPDEVQNIRYISWADLQIELNHQPDIFTPWLRFICNEVKILQ